MLYFRNVVMSKGQLNTEISSMKLLKMIAYIKMSLIGNITKCIAILDTETE